MSQIILDMGSGNTCRNDVKIVRKMIDELNKVNTGKHEVVIKWQLFVNGGDNLMLKRYVFGWAYEYARRKGYKTTASVFDISSLRHLLDYNIPFIKIACRPDLYDLIDEIPRKYKVYVSVPDMWWYEEMIDDGGCLLCCVSEYPAKIQDYTNRFKERFAWDSGLARPLKYISDHTVGWNLFKKYEPYVIEKHYKLPESIGLDAGDFAVTAEDLKEIL